LIRSQGHYGKNGNKFLHKANETYVKIHIAVYIKKSFTMPKRTNEPSITLRNPINEPRNHYLYQNP